MNSLANKTQQQQQAGPKHGRAGQSTKPAYREQPPTSAMSPPVHHEAPQFADEEATGRNERNDENMFSFLESKHVFGRCFQVWRERLGVLSILSAFMIIPGSAISLFFLIEASDDLSLIAQGALQGFDWFIGHLPLVLVMGLLEVWLLFGNDQSRS